MTIVEQLEQLEQKGIKRGWLKGWLEGWLDGRQGAKLEMARAMLQNGYDHSAIIKITGLTADDLGQIDSRLAALIWRSHNTTH